ncbi:MAG: hypothetical protein KME42_19390 [Tildeniella nuda ZEHNDER 1965/U140]|nr:hypothetical protein [Tildeniella nuda ZEHNDER 1965/U140]
MIRTAILSVALCLATGCTTTTTTPSARNSAPAANPQSSRQTTALPPKSQRFASDRQNQLDDQGYRDGYEDGMGGFPSNPAIGIANQNLTDPAEQKIYTDAYNRGYTQGKQPSPSPSPTDSISPDRRAELQRLGYQNGLTDAQSGFAANPGSGVAALGLTNATEIQIYTNAYNAGYQRQPSPSPSPTTSPGRLTQLRQQGYQDGYTDARSNFPQDAGRGISLLGLVSATEQQAYTNGYNSGYRAYTPVVQPPLPDVLW